MKHLRHFLISVTIIVLLSACQKDNTSRIAILHTNDTHGKLINFDKLSYLKDSLQNIYDTVLLISAGDMFSGNPYVDNYKERGFPMVDIMNKLEYNLAVIGNHEFDYGPDVLEDRINQANFPFIVGNIEVKEGFFASLESTHSIHIKGIDIKFIGFIETNNNGKPSTHPKQVEDLIFSEPIAKAKQILSDVIECDALIGLTHLGYNSDSILAMNNPEFDAIIGGHSHTLIKKPKIINNVLVAQAGENLEHAGLIELSFSNNKLVDKNYKLINFESLPEQNNQISKLIDFYQKNDFLDEILAVAKSPLKDRNEIGCLFTDAQLKYHNVDFVFQNYWGIRVNHISEGAITRKDILELDPFNNDLIIQSLTTNEIKSLIEYSYYLDKTIDLFIAGGTYTLETDKNDSLTAINIYDKNNLQINQTKTYKVGINSYVTSAYKYSCADSGKSSNTTTSENIIRYLEEVKEVNYNGCERVKIVKN